MEKVKKIKRRGICCSVIVAVVLISLSGISQPFSGVKQTAVISEMLDGLPMESINRENCIEEVYNYDGKYCFNSDETFVILETGFEETWVNDADGDYFAPPGWDIDGICRHNQDGNPNLTHYWSQLFDYEIEYDLDYSGVSSACVWWSDSNNEDDSVGYRQDERLITPTLNFSNIISINLTFWSTYCWDTDNSYFVEISWDNGTHWAVLADLSQDPEWEMGGDIPGWEDWNYFQYPVVLNLEDYSGQDSVKIAWHYYTDGTGTRGIWAVDEVMITGIDFGPPDISIERPGSFLYIADREITPTKTTIVIGKITAQIEASDTVSCVTKVELFIDENLKTEIDTIPYEWVWDEFVLFKHTIRAVAYDYSGNVATDEQEVWIFNL
jgi:hypothetical protein